MSATTLLFINAVCSFAGAAVGAFFGVRWFLKSVEDDNGGDDF